MGDPGSAPWSSAGFRPEYLGYRGQGPPRRMAGRLFPVAPAELRGQGRGKFFRVVGGNFPDFRRSISADPSARTGWVITSRRRWKT